MKTYMVNVVEEVTEHRTYAVKAESAREAAKIAAELWVNQGVEADGGPSVTVDDRTYIVDDETFGTDVES